ncbi:peptide ABC transporter substrate-binding protein [Alicyclobacillus hesperidum subsp. aegles]|uniref:peptide ABC transporter substrate-binding protein n=1 Tax=Alicyclobacillus hesperidum TaxID=89784 RepID=UPI00222A1170|nr:peptide ABC transporter substrate-binding protein [Alicyclobacillus hesperidum]GLG02522.1 peptide ABC transporter substrate-binding protein [Alicyclobacillus hesperidum subsp. aegles]
MNKPTRVTLAGLMTSALMLGLAGCGTNTNHLATTNQSTVNPTGSASTVTPQKGGVLIYALPPATNITWYFPIENGSNDTVANAMLSQQLYPGLFTINNQDAIDFRNGFATKITYNPTGTVYTIYLKKNWKWSDGTPVTAQDVVWDYSLIKATDASNAPAPWPNYNNGNGGVPKDVKSVVAVGKYMVKVTLNKPVNQQWFIYNGIGQLQPLPEHAWNKYPNDMTKEITYLGKVATDPTFFKVVDGPFKLQSAVSNRSWTLVPNPMYAGHKSLLSKLVFEYEASNDAEFAALKTGSVNLGYLDLSQYGSERALTSMGDTIEPGYSLGYNFVNVNFLKGSPLYSAMKDLKVRQALEMGIDQTTIDNDIYHGYAPPQYGPIPNVPKTVFYDPKLSKPIYPYNPSKAVKLLESDGWKLVNGVMTKNGQQLKFDMLYPSGSESYTQTAELMAQDWAKMGVIATLKPEPFATEISIMTNTNDPGGWVAAAETGIFYGGTYPSGESQFEPGAMDDYGYDDPTENKLIAKTIEPSSSEAETKKNFFAYEEYTAKMVPVLWTNEVATLTVVSPKVHNATPDYLIPTTGYPMFNYLWVSTN